MNFWGGMTPATAEGSSGLHTFLLYLKDFFRHISSRAILFTLLFIAVLISLNYTAGIESRIHGLEPWPLRLLGFFLFYAFVFFGTWGIQRACPRKQWAAQGEPGRGLGQTGSRAWVVLLTLAPLFFAFKMVRWDLSFLV
ncbi:MAG TPA: hypothetical protein VE035_00710, partial [Puia sp.]|nr:hypothetical protein [Puia sp.]